ncbi:hypothetical protein PhCBS80983_g00746 [Powellomyces hirtus]|uniref:RING-type E3 ubiquitin transferase n=1 Tax=Powellomyces hirtus TaxID=109895 RepID=A0A507EFX9_9FUNG|nr:hypothetical protein PhCBS80983_g00746 [Powellomyces hirtus]
MDDGERIRQKRLAKLASSATTTPADPSPASSSNTGFPAAITSPSVPRSPASQARPKIEEEPIAPPKPSPSASNARLVQQFIHQSDDEWENNAFQHVFQCCLDGPTAERKNRTFLPDLVREMQTEGTPLMISAAQVERVLYSRLLLESNAAPTSGSLFDYLVECWKRAINIRRKTLTVVEKGAGNAEVPRLAERRLATLQNAQDLLINYSGLTIHPDMAGSFPQPQSAIEEGPSCIARKMLNPNVDEAENALPRQFLDSFIARFKDDGLPEYLEYIARSLSAHMRQQTLLKDYVTPLRVLEMLVSLPPVAMTLPSLLIWNPSPTAKTIEVLSFLGPFFARISSFPDTDPTIAEHYFGSGNTFTDGNARMNDGFFIGSRNVGNIKTAMASLRTITESVQGTLHRIMMDIIRTGPEPREGVLKYFSYVLNLNIRRGRMQVDMREVSSDGFMYNLLQVALRMAEPLMKNQYSKLHLIDPDYFNYSDRLDISEQTRINADKEHYEQYLRDWRERNPSPTSAHFVADVFFLTLGFHHYGLMSSIRSFGQIVKQTEELRKHVEKLKVERDSGAWPPAARIMNETMLKRFQTQLDKMISYKLAMDTALRNRSAIEHTLYFYDLVMIWLLRCTVLHHPSVHHPPAQSGKGDNINWGRVARGDTQGLPFHELANPPPMAFTILPEWIIEDICDFYLFVMRYEGPTFEGLPRDAFLTFTMTFLANPSYMKNPHLKSKFVEILFTFTWPLYRTETGEGRGTLDDVLCTHPLAKALLVSNLMRFYVDAEHTGVSSQFYDKFNIRYHISQILKAIWTDSDHRRNVVKQSQNTEFFVRFAALLMNDATYLLDESLSKLKQIQQLQIELADPLPPTVTQEQQSQRDERVGFLKQLEGQATSYMSLGNETVHMLQYMTANPDIVQPFMQPEIVERLAAMLDYNLAAMVGPKCTDLKVKNPEKYRFEPKRLLKELIEIYIHLSHRSEFVSAVAKDERSYRKELFLRAQGILIKNMLKNSSELRILEEFVDKVEATIRSTQAEEEELGDVPDEYLDPLLYHIMEDPVILPTSGLSIDRSTIKSHLLSDAHDPFNRQPLTIEQVVTNDELRTKIQQWKRSKKDGGRSDLMEL